MTLDSNALLTDFYELSMVDIFESCHMEDTAVFEFFVRKFPAGRGFLMAAGLEQLVSSLANIRFTPDDISWLQSLRQFSPETLQSLSKFRFDGDVDAMPEGPSSFRRSPLFE